MKWLKRSVFGASLALVVSARPASAQSLEPLPAAEGASHPLDSMRFEPEEPGLTLMVRTGEMPYHNIQRFRRTWYYERGVVPLYTPLCDGACVTKLVPGEYQFALSKNGGKPLSAGVAVVVDGPSTIQASYESHRGERVFGGVILVGGVVGGVVMLVAGLEHRVCDTYGDCQGQSDGPLVAGGVGLFLSSLIVGTILASRGDVAHVMVTPLTLAPVGARRDFPALALGGASAAQGAALAVRF